MAFTFGTPTIDGVNGLYVGSATTNTSSAAGTFYPGFAPRRIRVIDTTNASVFEWVSGMAAASMLKTVTAGTTTVETSNGITVLAPTDATPAQASVTLGTGLHVNSSTYRIVCER